MRGSIAVSSDVFAVDIANIVEAPSDLTGDMRRDKDVVKVPKGRIFGQRLRRGYVANVSAESRNEARL